MKTTYKLDTLNCPDCATCLVKNLHKIDYIKEVDINYDTKMVSIEGINDLTEEQIKLVLDTVAKLSHCPKHSDEQTLVTEEFMFENIDCQNCASKVERALNKNNNIVNAKVNFITKKIIITHANNVSVYETVCDITRKVEDGAIITPPSDTKKEKNHQHKVVKEETINKNTLEKNKKLPLNKVISFSLTILGIIIFGLALVLEHLVKIPSFITYYLLYITSYLLISYEIIKKAFMNVIHGQLFDENFLMLIASIGALVLQESFEAIIVVLLYKIGSYLESLAVGKSTNAISALMKLKTDEVMLITGETVPVEKVTIGSKIIVPVGQVIPLDGIIYEGETSLDTSSLTGESLPKDVKENDQVLSGCINLTHVIKVKTTTIDSESTSSKVLKLVEEASNQKSKTENFITNFARIYTPIILGLAVLIFIVKFFIIKTTINESLNTCFVFLVISCPCALVISIPLGFFMGIGKASNYGILVKGGNYLEALTKTKVVVTDKTGTLTMGNFKIKEINTFNDTSEERLITLMASCERYSHHPLAKAVIEEFMNIENHEYLDVTDIEEIPGKGLKAIYQNKVILIGNKDLMEQNKVDYEEETCPGSVLYLAYDNLYLGNVLVGDEIKKGVPELINSLQKQNIKTIMLTGDNDNVAKSVKEKLHLDEYYAELLPNEKLDKLEEIIKTKESKKDTIIYIGDGINDTPSLKLADVGIAMGGLGSSAAAQAADIVLMKDDITKLDKALKISKYTKKIVYMNIIFALSFKILTLIIGITGILGSYAMLLGVFADVGVCVITVLNTLFIMKKNY